MLWTSAHYRCGQLGKGDTFRIHAERGGDEPGCFRRLVDVPVRRCRISWVPRSRLPKLEDQPRWDGLPLPVVPPSPGWHHQVHSAATTAHPHEELLGILALLHDASTRRPD